MHLKIIKEIIQNYLSLFLFIMLIFSSCEKELKPNQTWIIEPGSKILALKFPDSVYKNDLQVGYIKYDLRLDSISHDDVIDRWLYLYITTESKTPGLSAIKKSKYSIFLDTIGQGNFQFKLKFPNSGNKFINGTIEDVLLVQGKDTTKVFTIIYETNFLREFKVK
jgi:hypothetical protein